MIFPIMLVPTINPVPFVITVHIGVPPDKGSLLRGPWRDPKVKAASKVGR